MKYCCNLGCDAMQPGRNFPSSVLRIGASLSPGYDSCCQTTRCHILEEINLRIHNWSNGISFR